MAYAEDEHLKYEPPPMPEEDIVNFIESPEIDNVWWEDYSDSNINLERSLEEYQKERQKQKLIEKSDLHEMRKEHASRLFFLIVAWLVFMAVVVFAQGMYVYKIIQGDETVWKLSFSLSDAVLIALITSTTATVLGVYGVAAYWLFGKKDRKGKIA